MIDVKVTIKDPKIPNMYVRISMKDYVAFIKSQAEELNLIEKKEEPIFVIGNYRKLKGDVIND